MLDIHLATAAERMFRAVKSLLSAALSAQVGTIVVELYVNHAPKVILGACLLSASPTALKAWANVT